LTGNIYIVAVLIVARLRIVLLDYTVLLFKSIRNPVKRRFECFEPCPSMTSQKTRPRSHYARSWDI